VGFEMVKQPVLQAAREIVLDLGDVSPVVFLVKEQRIVTMTPLGTVPVPERIEENMKTRAAMYLYGGMVRVNPPPVEWDSVAFIATAWAVKPEPGEPMPKGPLARHPRRVEVLVFAYSRGPGDHDMEVIPFFRTPDGPVFEAPMERGTNIESLVMDSFWAGYNLMPPPIGFRRGA